MMPVYAGTGYVVDIGGPGGPGSGSGYALASGGGKEFAGGGCGGTGGGGTSLVSWKVVLGSTGVKRVAPTRNCGRTASRREAMNAGEGRPMRKMETFSGSAE